jgi:hypothetical protein
MNARKFSKLLCPAVCLIESSMLRAGRLAVIGCLISSGIAVAEPEKIGPLDLVVRINSIEVPVGAAGVLDLNTARGDFNASGELTISSDVAKVTNEATAIVKTLLPLRFELSDRELTIDDIIGLEIFPHDYEVDITVKAIASIGSSWLESQKEVTLSIDVVPRVTAGKTLSWQIVRQPKLGLPKLWWAAMELKGRHPNRVAGDAIQKWLDESAGFDVPSISGVRAAFRGANFDGNSKTIAFRIKGDAHTDGINFTSIMGKLTKDLSLDFTIKAPAKAK